MTAFSPPPQKGYDGFPGWFYGPKGEAQVFKRAQDVPAGWTNHSQPGVGTPPPDAPKPKVAAKVAAAPKKTPQLTREQVTTALKEAGVTFNPTASLAALYEQLEAVAADD